MKEEINYSKGKGSDFNEALKIREQVFVLEQKIPLSIELDEFDQIAWHFVLTIDGSSVSTARILISDNKAVIGRVATLKKFRHRQITSKFIISIEDWLKGHDVTYIEMHAQITALPFYKKLGYQTSGSEFLEAGIEHINIYKDLI